MKCAEIREALPAYERDSEATLAVRRHLAFCSDCKREVARYREVQAGFENMRAASVEVPAALSRALFEIPANQSLVGSVRTHVARNRRAYVGGAAVAAGALGATIWRLRSRHTATA
ncbi:MAG TPA: hypothetical protein VEV82_06740 [Actinomycetota bacterium]|nr:hypothetical protein [Actinomycetota bacterium]